MRFYVTYRDIIEHLCSKLRSFGSDFWWKLPVEELLPSTYSQCGGEYVKGEVTRFIKHYHCFVCVD